MSDHVYELSEYPDGATLEAATLHRRVEADPGLAGVTLIGVRHEWDPNDPEFVERARYRFAEDLDAGQIAALDALVAGHVVETLAEAQDRCVGECKAWRDAKLESPGEDFGILVEFPASSGKKWPATFVDRAHWAALEQSKGAWSYPMTRRTWDEKQSHSFANSAEVSSIHDAIRDAVMAEINACDTAIANVIAAADIPAAEAAAAAYVGT